MNEFQRGMDIALHIAVEAVEEMKHEYEDFYSDDLKAAYDKGVADCKVMLEDLRDVL